MKNSLSRLYRKTIILIAVAVILVMIYFPASAANNLLKNPGFEQGYTNWDSLQDFTIDPPGHTGSKALYIQSLDRAVVSQCLPITQAEWNSWSDVNGFKYLDADGWIKTDQNVDRVYIEIWIWNDSTAISPCNGAGSHWSSIVLSANQDWTHLSQAPNAVFNPFAIDEKPAAISVYLVVEAQEGSYATAAFDDLNLMNVMPGSVTLSDFSVTQGVPVGIWILFGSLFCLAVILLKLKTA